MDNFKNDSQRFKLLLEELGRCLLIYQSIEGTLKRLLPHMVAPGTEGDVPAEGIENWRFYIDSKQTLGPLVEVMKRRVSARDPSAVDVELRKLVSYRNEVIHHFIEQPFGRLESEEDFQAAMEFLRVRREAAIPLFDSLQGLLREFYQTLTSQKQQNGTQIQ